MALPSGQTTPSANLPSPTLLEAGSDRYLLVPEPPLPDTLTLADERPTTSP
ncbi:MULTISPECIES: hypothetical protein [Cyanophyceae]|uniref:hypothetical protein n=1 Tax=Cyanophyceae TaxID=3028117 RepID=UPI0016893A7C|nr:MULTISPECIES: hypothetical protein [Cyanophyceae]MBD1916780.1 hypothetical protein [Phormidium sp. FACHB-77]MBD2029410.1 hypothetical protein [Phormidium sp. FACHB-322]MBD2051985.1 hypothetical protein [Leptolyngbya sp. FACHB-60]